MLNKVKALEIIEQQLQVCAQELDLFTASFVGSLYLFHLLYDTHPTYQKKNVWDALFRLVTSPMRIEDIVQSLTVLRELKDTTDVVREVYDVFLQEMREENHV